MSNSPTRIRISTIFSCLVAAAIAGAAIACSGDTKPATAQQGEALTAPSATDGTAGTAGSAPTPGHRKHRHAFGAGDRGGHGRGSRVARLFQRFDPQGTGQLELAKLPPRLATFLAKADANSDGFVTRAELDQARAAMKARFLKAADTDGDGKVSTAERQAFMAQRRSAWFAKLDQNGDGALTEAEVGAKKWQFISRADTNHDGQVTLAEFLAAPHPRFHRGHHGKRAPNGTAGSPG